MTEPQSHPTEMIRLRGSEWVKLAAILLVQFGGVVAIMRTDIQLNKRDISFNSKQISDLKTANDNTIQLLRDTAGVIGRLEERMNAVRDSVDHNQNQRN